MAIYLKTKSVIEEVFETIPLNAKERREMEAISQIK